MKYLDYREIRTQDTASFPVSYYHVAPGHPRYEMPYHWHPEYEIIRILSGSFQFTLDGETEEVSAGEMLFLRGGTLHGGIPKDCIYECLVFDMDSLLKSSRLRLPQIQNMIDHRICMLRRPDMTALQVRSTTENLFGAIREKKEGYELATLGCLYLLFGTLLAEKQYHILSDTILTDPHQLASCKRVLDYMVAHFAEDISLEQLSKIAGMTPKYFCRYFRSMTQKTPIDYLNYYRIETACEMLSSRYITVAEAGRRCGFHDTSYFVKMFRRYKSVTPKKYLKETFQA